MPKPCTMNLDSDPGASMTVGAMARHAQCTLRSIRFYEQRGLLLVEGRTGGRHRRYGQRELERLKSIVRLRRAGVSIEDIRAILEVRRLSSTGATAAVELRRQLENHIATVAARISELANVKGELERLHAAISVCTTCRSREAFERACRDCRSLTAVETSPLLRAIWSHSS